MPKARYSNWLALAAPLAALPVTALAQDAPDTAVVYGGGTVGEGFSTYAGAVVALPGATLGNGLAIRAGGGGGEYTYQTGGTEIDGSYLSAEVALVYQTSGDWGWANFGIGPRVTDTDLDPADPANELSGTQWDAAVQTDGALGYRWRLGWFGSLGVFDQTYITELRLGRLVDESRQTRLGVEGAVQGDDSYTQAQAGVFASTLLANKVEGRISGGLSEQRGRGARGYVSVALSHTF